MFCDFVIERYAMRARESGPHTDPRRELNLLALSQKATTKHQSFSRRRGQGPAWKQQSGWLYSLRPPICRSLFFGSGTMSRTIAAAVDAAALRFPSRLALTSPFQSQQRFTYHELQTTTKGLAVWLSKKYGFEKHDLLVSDLPNVSENLLLQIACNRTWRVWPSFPR